MIGERNINIVQFIRLNKTLHTSRISSVGMCGKKSLPTKKQMNIKSSTMRSESISIGELGICISSSKYSLRVQMLRNCQNRDKSLNILSRIIHKYAKHVPQVLSNKTYIHKCSKLKILNPKITTPNIQFQGIMLDTDSLPLFLSYQ